jgi:type I restriction enzyme R subunit
VFLQEFFSSLAIKYYSEFKKQIEKDNKDLRVATIFSFAPNEEEIDGILADENLDADNLDQSSRDFLESAIKDYNK